MSKGDDRMKESYGCAELHEWDAANGVWSVRAVFAVFATCDLNFQNGKYSHKTKYSFLSTYIILVLLENSMHKKILSFKCKTQSDSKFRDS